MTLLASEVMSGGFVRDPDGRLVVVQGMAGIPSGATPLTGQSGNVAAATATATLAGAAGLTTYITGFEVTGAGATAASVVNVTVANTTGGNLTYVFAVPAGVTVGAQPLTVEFPEPIPANAANTSIITSMPSLGAGNTNAAINAHGFRL